MTVTLSPKTLFQIITSFTSAVLGGAIGLYLMDALWFNFTDNIEWDENAVQWGLAAIGAATLFSLGLAAAGALFGWKVGKRGRDWETRVLFLSIWSFFSIGITCLLMFFLAPSGPVVLLGVFSTLIFSIAPWLLRNEGIL